MGALIPAIITAVLAGTVSSTTDKAVLRIALLVDTSAGTREDFPQLRRGLTALLAAIPDDQEIALISTGRRVETRVPPTLDRKKLQNSVNSLLPGDGPTPLMDAIIEVDERFMRNAGNRSPLFVIITGDGSESSKLVEGEMFNRWLTTLQQRSVVAVIGDGSIHIIRLRRFGPLRIQIAKGLFIGCTGVSRRRRTACGSQQQSGHTAA